MNRRRGSDERGATAVMVSILALVLMGVAALSVDLGNAFVHKRERQKDTDLSTLAGGGVGGANLPAPAVGKSCGYGPGALPTDPAVRDVATYLLKQLGPPGADTDPAVIETWAKQLTNCDVDKDGEVFYGKPKRGSSGWTLAYNKNQLSLVSPPDHVPFGLAGALGFSGVDVLGQATLEIRSPRMSTLPFYAFRSCDWGPQTLQEPNNGHAADPVLLANASETNAATVTSISPTAYPAGTATGTLQPITILGSNFSGTKPVTEIGFFEPGNGIPGPAPVTTTTFTIDSSGKITVPDLPDQARGVSGVQSFWYVRVKVNGKWSAVSYGSSTYTPVLTIGDPPLICGQGSSSGNFGTLLLENAVGGGADKQGAANVALGLDSTLAIFPLANQTDEGLCTPTSQGSIVWKAAGTNCVGTDTGMSSKVATGGFLGIGSASPGVGLLRVGTGAAKPNKSKCGPGGTPATTVVEGVTINNDTLTCFLINSTTSVGDIDVEHYAGGPVLSADIFDSPRFGYVPVLKVQPANGRSKMYQIFDFRPCFITDQTASARRGDPPSATNGIIMKGSAVQSVQVVFLNPDAMPPLSSTSGTIGYNGSGPKIPLLVD